MPDNLAVTFWGVRGSIPTPGGSTQRWGGNSSCLEITAAGLPPMVLDCGTGARLLGQKLIAHPGRELELLFTHFHMDHVFGFPFFIPIYAPGYRIRITAPAYSEEEAREKLARFLNGMYHPTRLRDLPSEVSFSAIRPGKWFDRSGYRVLGHALNHPGGSTGYRIEAHGKTICYVTDTAPFAKPGEGVAYDRQPTPPEAKLLAWLEGADVVVYDTMYEHTEYLEKMTWGHSYPEYAEALCRKAGVKHLVLFHHEPNATDDDLDALAERWSGASGPRVTLAREGETVHAEG